MTTLRQCIRIIALLIFTASTEAAVPSKDSRPAGPARRGGAENLKRMRHDAREHRLSQLESTISTPQEGKELRGIMLKGDTYDPSLFSKEHIAFKAAHNDIFTTLGARMISQKVNNGGYDEKEKGILFYLDGVDASTTKALLASSTIGGDRLLTCNRHLETCIAIRKVADSCGGTDCRIIHDNAVSALEKLDQEPIVGFYFDACSGLVEPLLDIFKVILKPNKDDQTAWRHPEICFGVSLTAACPSGESLFDREQRLLRQVKQLSKGVGYNYMHRVADDPRRWGLQEEAPRFVDGCLTTWIVLS